MVGTPGRDQRAPMERLVRLVGALNTHHAGASLPILLTAVSEPGYHPGDDSETQEVARRKMLQRDLDHLNALGYDVRNTAEAGGDGVYLMRARDNRLQVSLDAEQRGELLRAAIAAGLTGMATHLAPEPKDPKAAGAAGSGAAAPPLPVSADLDLVQRATARRCRLRFTYKGEPRVVNPALVHSGPSGWYLTAREDGSRLDKEFVVSRMTGLALDQPGSAVSLDEPVRRSLDPLSWEVDPATEVVLRVPSEHEVLATNLLGTPATTTMDGSDLLLGYRVTHRRVFRFRLYELGTRVLVVSPHDIRAEIVSELETFLALPGKTAAGGSVPDAHEPTGGTP